MLMPAVVNFDNLYDLLEVMNDAPCNTDCDLFAGLSDLSSRHPARCGGSIKNTSGTPGSARQAAITIPKMDL